MSKKDKKRIAELERQQSILAAKVRVLAHYFSQVLAAKEQPQFEHGSVPQSEPKQGETAKDSPTRDCANQSKIDWANAKMRNSFFNKPKCAGFCEGENVLNKSTFDWLKQPKPAPAQPEPAMTEKEQELLGKLNAELAKFASLEVFNADRKNFFLPPVGKLEFDKMKAAIECSIAIAKMVRPDYFDQINQIKVPASEQPEAEQKQPEIHPPNPQKAALNKIFLHRFKEAEKLLANPNFGVGELSFFIDDWAKELQLVLADFRRKHLDLGEVEPCKVDLRNSELGEVEPKETVQGKEKQPQTDHTSPEKDGEKLGEADHTETEKQQVWIVQTNPKQINGINPTFFYIESLDEKLVITHTMDPDDAMQFKSYIDAQSQVNQIVAESEHWLDADCFKIVEKPTRTI
jgi:hypothetical protein